MSCYDRTHFFKKDDTFLDESQIDLTCDVKYVDKYEIVTLHNNHVMLHTAAGKSQFPRSALTARMSAPQLSRSDVNPRNAILFSQLLTSGVSILEVDASVFDKFIYSHLLDNWHYANKALTREKSAEPYDQRCSFPFIIK